jgi:hypothetical protein
MQGIRPASLTNQELARTIHSEGTKNLSPEVLEHVALRFIELFGHNQNSHSAHVTRVPFVA